MLLKTNNRFLTNSGQEMKAKLQVIQQFMKKAENQVSPKTSNDFITKEFLPFYEKHGSLFCDSLISHLLKHMINVTNGKTNSHIGEKAMNFFMLISTASAQAQQYASANLFGPNIRSLRRFYRKVDQGNNLPLIINRKKEDIHQLVMNHIKKSFKKTTSSCS